jgi:hypothetical protein
MGMSADLFDLDEMGNAFDHPADLWAIRVFDGVVDPPQAKGAECPALFGLRADRGPNLGDLEYGGHGYLTSTVSCLGA